MLVWSGQNVSGQQAPSSRHRQPLTTPTANVVVIQMRGSNSQDRRWALNRRQISTTGCFGLATRHNTCACNSIGRSLHQPMRAADSAAHSHCSVVKTRPGRPRPSIINPIPTLWVIRAPLHKGGANQQATSNHQQAANSCTSCCCPLRLMMKKPTTLHV